MADDSEKLPRRLNAILLADMHGYSALMEDVTFRDLGPQALKNIREPIRVYAVAPERGAGSGTTGALGPTPVPDARRRVTRRLVLAGAVAAAGGFALWRSAPGWRAWLDGSGGLALSGGPLVLGVMAVRAHGAVPAWMTDLTRDGLNTVLSRQPNLLVYSRQKIDFLREKRGLTEIEAAEQLGITKMISAALSGTAARLALEVQVVDIGTGLIEGAHEGHGSERELLEMQNDAALDVMQALKVPVDQELARLLTARTNDRLQEYKLLTESMGGGSEDAPASREPRSGRDSLRRLADLVVRDAHAGANETEIEALLERYRRALESEDIAQVEALHVTLPPALREALGKYWKHVKRLHVRFSRLDILVEGDEALATFTRSDEFSDAWSGVPVDLEVRVSYVVTRQDGAWKILGFKRRV